MKIYHNPRCGKSRQTLGLITESGVEPEIVLYMKDALTVEELSETINLLGIKPEALLRKKESIFKENFAGKSLTDAEWIQVMVEHPKLMERPIVIKGDKAIIGRPPENVLSLL